MVDGSDAIQDGVALRSPNPASAAPADAARQRDLLEWAITANRDERRPRREWRPGSPAA